VVARYPVTGRRQRPGGKTLARRQRGVARESGAAR
jgi:hypothetical protein